MKNQDLKALVKEVVRECVNEVKTRKSLQEAGLTSEMGDESHDYDEGQEIRLIQGLNLIVKKLMVMHGENKMGGIAENKKTCNPKRKALAERFKNSVCEVNQMCEFMLHEASYKQVAPNEVDTAKEDKARTIQTDPKVTKNKETKTCEKCKKSFTPSYGEYARCQSCAAGDAEAGERATGVEENSKVQHRSAVTVKDLPNDPNNVRSAHVPTS
jgi:hypothetical protein